MIGRIKIERELFESVPIAAALVIGRTPRKKLLWSNVDPLLLLSDLEISR